MITVIVCSVNPALAQQSKENILNTIGVPFEWIGIDNRIDPRGITAVYNEGARRARYDTLVFVHEDVAFQTPNWGKLLLDIFQRHPRVGAVGVAGSSYKSKHLSGWYTGIKELDSCNVTHVDPDKNSEHLFFHPNSDCQLERVVVIDGVFMATRKTVWEKVGFDEQNLKGFHFYDIDFSLRASWVTELMVTLQIDLLHFTTGGDFGDKWVEQALIWHHLEHIRNRLPASCTTSSIPASTASRIARTWFSFLMKKKINYSNRFIWVFKQGFRNSFQNAFSVGAFLVYPVLRKTWRAKK